MGVLRPGVSLTVNIYNIPRARCQVVSAFIRRYFSAFCEFFPHFAVFFRIFAMLICVPDLGTSDCFIFPVENLAVDQVLSVVAARIEHRVCFDALSGVAARLVATAAAE